jgi:D-lactate dehydrogenase (cytochrome)
MQLQATAAHRPLASSLVAALGELLGERFTTNAAICAHHGRDESPFPPMPPDAVAFPRSTEEVAAIARLCSAHTTPMIPFGIGTSVEGHVLAAHGGVTIDLSRMHCVLAVHADDLDVVVEAGVTWKQLNAQLRDQGLFFPLDPGADATLGGMAATRASGTNAVRYGTMRENVLGLTVVLADGTVIRTGTRARKSAAGYDLTRLMVGSEGTLGIITELILRVHPLPEAVVAAVCRFPSVRAAVETAIAALQSAVPIARCELLDAATIAAVNRHARLGAREAPTLFMEFHGTPAGVREQATIVEALAAERGGESFEGAETPEARSALWAARHQAYFACLALRPGCRVFSTDICVPISQLAEVIQLTQEDVEDTRQRVQLGEGQMPVILLGHVGDGNFHLGINLDTACPAELAAAEAIHERLAARALALGGTCSGEHGIGLGKQALLAREHGAAVPVMRAVKQALDPLGLLNPGKVLPPAP